MECESPEKLNRLRFAYDSVHRNKANVSHMWNIFSEQSAAGTERVSDQRNCKIKSKAAKHLHQQVVFTCICLSVSRMTQKLLNRFPTISDGGRVSAQNTSLTSGAAQIKDGSGSFISHRHEHDDRNQAGRCEREQSDGKSVRSQDVLFEWLVEFLKSFYKFIHVFSTKYSCDHFFPDHLSIYDINHFEAPHISDDRQLFLWQETRFWHRTQTQTSELKQTKNISAELLLQAR